MTGQPAYPGWRGFWAFGLAFGYVALIWFLSSQVLEIKVIDRVPLRDKGVHFVEYGMLALLFSRAFAQSHPGRHGLRLAAAAVWLTLTAGMMDELHQAFVFGRSADVADLCADAIGACLFAGAYMALRHLLRARGGAISRA